MSTLITFVWLIIFLNNNLNYWVIGLVCYEKCPAVPQKGERPIKQFNHKLTQFTLG